MWYGCFSRMYVCTPVCLVSTEAKRRHQIRLGLEYQVVISCHGGTGNQTLAL